MKRMIYFNNAATSNPKPPQVMTAILKSLSDPHNESTRSCNCKKNSKDDDIVCKSIIKKFFNLPQSYNVIFTPGATYAFNVVVNHLIKDLGIKKCFCTYQEHNSVYRVVNERIGDVEYIPFDQDRHLCFDNIQLSGCVFINHECNVDGNLIDLKEALSHIPNDIPVIIDITQSAGTFDIDVASFKRDNLYLVCSTHKGLMSLSGLGFLVYPSGVKFSPFILGGTGDQSIITTETPSLEAGTSNMTAIASLLGGFAHLSEATPSFVRYRKNNLTTYFLETLKKMPCYLPIINQYYPIEEHRVNFESGIISMCVLGDKGNAIVNKLQEKGYIVRHGMHCSPLYHLNVLKCKTTIRISLGVFNTMDQIDSFCSDLNDIITKLYFRELGS